MDMAMANGAIERRRREVAGKLRRARELMARRSLDALRLTTIASTAWLTAGAATYVDESVDSAACTLLVTPDEALVLTDPIEEPRLRSEERLDALGFTFVVEPWHALGQALRQRITGRRVGCDAPAHPGDGYDLRADLAALRSRLTSDEQDRLRMGARLSAEAMWEAVRGLAPGMTEHEAAALLSAATRKRGGSATVVLVGSDERIADFRHPLATAKTIRETVMLVLCFRYQGLVSALTRTVYFGEAPESLRSLTDAVARVDAQVIAATQPGRTLGEMFDILREAYTREGAPEAIEQHHQGGTIAYMGRETFARPGSLTRIESGQAFAWNPSLRGAKSEDTVLLTDNGLEIVTAMDGWPTLPIATETGVIARPALLELRRD